MLRHHNFLDCPIRNWATATWTLRCVLLPTPPLHTYHNTTSPLSSEAVLQTGSARFRSNTMQHQKTMDREENIFLLNNYTPQASAQCLCIVHGTFVGLTTGLYDIFRYATGRNAVASLQHRSRSCITLACVSWRFFRCLYASCVRWNRKCYFSIGSIFKLYHFKVWKLAINGSINDGDFTWYIILSRIFVISAPNLLKSNVSLFVYISVNV